MICDHDAWTNALNTPCLLANIINAKQQQRCSGLLLIIATIKCVTLFSTNSVWLVSQDEWLYSCNNQLSGGDDNNSESNKEGDKGDKGGFNNSKQ